MKGCYCNRDRTKKKKKTFSQIIKTTAKQTKAESAKSPFACESISDVYDLKTKMLTLSFMVSKRYRLDQDIVEINYLLTTASH